MINNPKEKALETVANNKGENNSLGTSSLLGEMSLAMGIVVVVGMFPVILIGALFLVVNYDPKQALK